MGANVYGEVATEHLTFNEKTLWTGGPSSSRPNYQGGNLENKGNNGQTLKNIQKLFAEGKNSEAANLCNQLTGATDGYGSYQPWGDIYLKVNGLSDSGAAEYERSLDIENGLANVSFKQGGTAYTREFFASNPDNVIAGQLTSEGDPMNAEIRSPPSRVARRLLRAISLRLRVRFLTISSSTIPSSRLKPRAVLLRHPVTSWLSRAPTRFHSSLPRQRIIRTTTRHIARASLASSCTLAFRLRQTLPPARGTTPFVPIMLPT